MKRTLLCFCLMLFFEIISFSQLKVDSKSSATNLKSRFDILNPDLSTQRKSGTFDNYKRLIRKQVWEYTLMQDGYFTIGTNEGISSQLIDDKCEITFGHPYAMTSFAYPIIDSIKFFPFELSGNTEMKVQVSGDTLFSRQALNSGLQLETFIYLNQSGNLNFKYQIINSDSISHNIGMGLLFDAALGKWGDGFVTMDNGVLEEYTKIEGAGIDSIIIMERKQSPKGMGVILNFEDNAPGEIIFGNWFNEYYGDTAINKLYDLAIHSKWKNADVLSGDSTYFKIGFSIPVPDNNDQVFMRWDMPNFLSIENQKLFPSELISKTEIINNSLVNNGLILKFEKSDFINPWESKTPFNLSSPNTLFYEDVNLSFPEIYNSKVIPFKLSLMQSGIPLDELTRNILIPASPFSDTGLVVKIDTAYLNFGKVYFSFNCAREETEQLIYNLHKNNIFLYENNSPVEAFTLEKDTTGGTNNADIIFVLDVTGSMSEEIEGVRKNIIEFADSLSYKGINYRLGMVTFLDEIENIYDFTENVQEFQMNVSAQYAHAGADRPENSLDALSAASQFNFREDANRIIIWITDADFHINDSYTQQTKESVIDQLLGAGITVNCIGDPIFQTDYYDQITLSTGGSFFNINQNFRDILLEVSRLKQATNYLLSFYHPGVINQGDIFKIEAHFSGLGGEDSIIFGSGFKSLSQSELTKIEVFPNPFYHQLHLRITGSDINTYRIELFNMQGQLLNKQVIHGNSDIIEIELSRFLSQQDIETSKIFLLKTTTISPGGDILHYQTKKIQKF